MLSPKLFILSECENVKAALDHSLRHDFGNERSKPYFDEVNLRLAAFRTRFSSVGDDAVGSLTTASAIISELSSCLSLIERSRLGEFSWAFAEAFQELAKPICREKTSVDEDGFIDPIFFLSSKGGLKAYQIVCESAQLIDIGRQRIFNIVFPHSLTHHVLLHAILGHELCHAALGLDKQLAKIRSEFDASITLRNSQNATLWYQKIHARCAPVTDEHLNRWKVEFLCDLFGLVLMGPAFLAAIKALLAGVDPTGLGDELSQRSHPPPLSRIRLLQQAANIIGWHGNVQLTGNSRKAYAQLTAELNSFRTTDAANYEIINPEALKPIIAQLEHYFASVDTKSYSKLNERITGRLYEDLYEGIPPSGGRLNSAKRVANERVDFRLQLTAGWMRWASHSKSKANEKPDSTSDIKWFKTVRDKFLFVNRLCERGILQQQAICLALDNKHKRP